MAQFEIERAGTILAVSDFERSVVFYRDTLGLGVEARYDDPPYATLVAGGARLSLAEQGHASEDRPGVTMAAPDDVSRASVVVVLEVSDARAAYAELESRGARFLAEPYEPPWGGCRFFCVDPDGYLVEIEQPA